MKLKSKLMLVSFLIVGACASAQTLPRTNDMTGVDAIKVASGLSEGMLEADAKKFLNQNGLRHFGPWFPIGEYGWSSWYPLKEGSALVIGVSAPPSPCNVWTNGYLMLSCLVNVFGAFNVSGARWPAPKKGQGNICANAMNCFFGAGNWVGCLLASSLISRIPLTPECLGKQKENWAASRRPTFRSPFASINLRSVVQAPRNARPLFRGKAAW